MPIYEFHSPDTGKIYSFFAPSSSYSQFVPYCPDGKEKKMVKVLSCFSITGKKEDIPDNPLDANTDDPFAGMDPNQANQMMKELERSISGIDEENPDPKQMGLLMRRMCELSGERMDEPMEEVIRKLEEGMNPEEVEERMGDLGGEEENGETMQSLDEDDTSVKSKLKKLLMQRPRRDPILYDFRDYINESN